MRGDSKAYMIEALNGVLPTHWSHGGDAGPDRYEQAVRIAAGDVNTGGLLVIMTPQAMSDPVEIAKKPGKMAPAA